ncbi:RHS repeat-associated core domain-containing protein [Streptomyces sp. DSM 41527]|uniref:RHS repeat-associated core domain-containing protein n=1 Tax=Streptomyces mooreae TaxID=3075523 RepID=A0ABU2T950_9ACTN|nr:DUF6531 domain-containing protein [Streptomyces sp. DSM 41527]MDT0457436.1 RHS repeat-associated core domain-containing protein [Streptomyces sp. DSM 41527]
MDEDDYREMATAMREFADDINEGANEAHQAIQGLVGSAGGSLAVEALNAHWGKINGTHLKNLGECGRMTATALDGVAVLIEGAKIGALVQLGILAAEVIAAQAAAPFTLGLSEVGALAATQATRVIVKRLFKEVCQQVAEQVISIALTPVEEALGAMVGDLVVQLGANALGVQDGVDLNRTANAGKEGFNPGVQNAKDATKSAAGNPMELLSAGGSSGGGGGGGGAGAAGGFSFDPDEHDRVVTGLQSAGGTFRNKAGGKLGRARSHHGRTRGKDAIADAANAMLDKVIDGIADGVKKTAKHLDDNMTRGIKQMAKNHRDNDKGLADHFQGLGKGGEKGPKAPSGGRKLSDSTSEGKKSKSREQLDKEHSNSYTRKDSAVEGCGDPVDVATGRVFIQKIDLRLPASLPLIISRKYESSYRAGHRFGPSWSSTLDQRLDLDEQGIVFVTESGLLLSYEYPEDGNEVLPSSGPRWPLTRTSEGDWSIHDPESGSTRYFAHTGASTALIDEISDRNGNCITFDYDEHSDALTDIRHSAGYHVKLSGDDYGRITTICLAGAGESGADLLVMSYGHDADGNLVTVTNASGAKARFEYDDEYRLSAWVDTNDRRYEYVYDRYSRCIAESGEQGHLRYRFHYGERDLYTRNSVTEVTNSLGFTTCYLINDRLQITAITDPLGRTSRSEYDEFDCLLRAIDPLGRTTSYEYDEGGRLLAVSPADEVPATRSYNSLGLPVSYVAPNGAEWHYQYDDRGNRTALTDPSGAVTRFTFDGRGNIADISDDLGALVSIECDKAGLVSLARDPLGNALNYRRDAFGRVISISDSLGATQRLVWSPEGRLIARVSPDGAEERWTYDGEGNCLSHKKPAGGTTVYEYTHFNQLAAQVNPDGGRYEFTYDTELQLVEVRNPYGLTWEYQYDPTGALVSEKDFNGSTYSYSYDLAGQVVRRDNSVGQSIGYTYDPLGRLTEKDVDGQLTNFMYDANGHLTQARNEQADLIFHRDALGRVVTETVNGRSVRIARDARGRRTSRTTPSGVTGEWTFDQAGRRKACAILGHTMAFEHDAVGREVARHIGEDLSLTQSWDASGHLTSQVVQGASRIIQQRRYSYQHGGALVGINDALNGPRNFTTDVMGRVTAVDAGGWTESYSYDSAGRQSAAHWPARHPSQEARGARTYAGTLVGRAGSIRYEYDAHGRLVLRQKARLSRKPDTWRYTWDAEDRLTSVVTPDGRLWRYGYDAIGRRRLKQCLNSGGEILEQVEFSWDGTNLAEQTSTASGSSTSVTLTWEYSGIRPIAQTEQKRRVNAPQEDVDRRFFAIVTDLIGTPAELVDESAQICWRTRSSLWGTTAWSSKSSAYTPLRFPGQYFDSETGFHYNFHRYYDPDTGRYISPDPLGLQPAPDSHQYVHNPLLWLDPLGLAKKGSIGCDDFEPDDLEEWADHAEVKGAEYAAEYTSPAGNRYYGYNAQGLDTPGALGAIFEQNDHHGACAETNALVRAYTREGPEAIYGGRMSVVHVSDTPEWEHGQTARGCGRCRRLLPNLGIG